MKKIEFIPFDINFPIKIFSKEKVNFEDEKIRNKIFNNSLYQYQYNNIRNNVPEKRWKILLLLAKKIEFDFKLENPDIKVLSISAFGSSLYSNNNSDYDFLIIIEGNKFDMIEKYISIDDLGCKYKIGISIKGLDNFNYGIIDKKSKTPIRLQYQVIYRTVISLSKRHIPILGYNFYDNKEIFLKNCYAQTSDLLLNCYDLYYIKNKILSNKIRSHKILSRLYEASLYLNSINKTNESQEIKKQIFYLKESGIKLSESKVIFEDFVSLYDKLIKTFYSRQQSKKNPLEILQNKRAKESIILRLKEYWEFADLPFEWIEDIINILSKNYKNENIALKKIRQNFSKITEQKSQEYSIKLSKFRARKVSILSSYLNKKIIGKVIMDFGGRNTDFAESILKNNKTIKKVYITDIGSYVKTPKNKKIEFVVQPSLNSIPVKDKTIDTIIISMVLHHIPKENYKNLFSEIKRILSKNGKIIIIEDSYPQKNINLSKEINTNNHLFKFLNLNDKTKKDILYFYDWFGNKLMRNRDTMPIIQNFKSTEEWIQIFKENNLECIGKLFIQSPELCLFPPKSILSFKKNN